MEQEGYMTALSQKEKDSRRSSTFIRIEIALLNVIRRFAKQNRSTVKAEVDSVLRERFFKVRK